MPANQEESRGSASRQRSTGARSAPPKSVALRNTARKKLAEAQPRGVATIVSIPENSSSFGPTADKKAQGNRLTALTESIEPQEAIDATTGSAPLTVLQSGPTSSHGQTTSSPDKGMPQSESSAQAVGKPTAGKSASQKQVKNM